MAVKALKFFSYSILIVFFLAVLIFGAQFFNFFAIYKEAKAGKSDLEQAVFLAREQDFKGALIFSRKATDNFNSAIEMLKDARKGFFISRLDFFKSQFNDVEYLLSTAEILSRATTEGLNFAKSLEDLLGGGNKLSFSKFSKEEKKKILGRIYEAGPEIYGMKANLDLALLSLEQISYKGALWPLKNSIFGLREKIEEGRNILREAVPLSRILPVLAGYPAKTFYLVLLQNSDELRPTGGFLGTYGILEVEYGDILRFETHDIYHMDMPIKDKLDILPPEPIKKYLVSKWYMRDANWSPDWPTAASKIEWFYKTEDELLPPENKINNFNGEFAGVIAITPKFITDLFSLTGPVEVEGEEYNADNFVNLLEYRVEKGYAQLGVPSWHRKEVIGEIAKELKIRLMDMPAARWKDIIAVTEDNIIKKNIFVYFKDKETEGLIKENGWGGEMKEVFESDYLMAVDANMGSLKTDVVMSKSMDYKVEESVDGLTAKLRLNYSHRGGFDWKTTRYRSYTRVYVPLGSQLIKAEGATEKDIKVQNELGKTSFGAFISIEPGQIGSLYFEYKLPEYVAGELKNGTYNLYVQKQAGNDINSLSVDVKSADAIKSYSPASLSVVKVSDKEIRWEGDLSGDRRYEVELGNRE